MPTGMFNALTERNITAEYSKIKEILDFAVNYEWHQSIRDQYAEKRRAQSSRQAESSTNPESKSKISKDSPRLAMGRRDTTKRYRFVKREPFRNEPPRRDYRSDNERVIPRDTSRPGGRDGGGKGEKHVNFRQYPKPSQGAKPPVAQNGGSKTPKCYQCGGPHYRNQCDQNKDRNPILYHGREIVDDTEEGDKKPHESEDSSKREEPEERLNQVIDDDADSAGPADGEQYDSDYTLEECSEYSEYDNDERCYHIIVEEEDELPELRSEYDDSDTDSDSESEYCCSVEDWTDAESESEIGEPAPAAPPKSVLPTRREPTLSELGLFDVWDDYSDEEFVTDNDINELAKDMANCLIQTRDPETVLEYFSAARVANDGVPRPRPARTTIWDPLAGHTSYLATCLLHRPGLMHAGGCEWKIELRALTKVGLRSEG
ncbi:hypothetical protein K438DRAFT_1967171 [Mycena galopus ATCC 62051]|nr:hypothetical protein K438DRAFT_1967171 [Mycena galopus ATCC 62051]